MSLIVSACAGTNFDWSRAKQVQIGTTEAELIQLLGRPYLIKTKGDSQVWVWSHASAFTGTRVVSYELKDGRVTVIPNTEPFAD